MVKYGILSRAYLLQAKWDSNETSLKFTTMKSSVLA
jgi:hypothetical protein